MAPSKAAQKTAAHGKSVQSAGGKGKNTAKILIISVAAVLVVAAAAVFGIHYFTNVDTPAADPGYSSESEPESSEPDNSVRFPEGTKVSPWAADAVAWAYGNSIYAATDGDPSDPAFRGWMAQVIYNFVGYLIQ